MADSLSKAKFNGVQRQEPGDLYQLVKIVHKRHAHVPHYEDSAEGVTTVFYAILSALRKLDRGMLMKVKPEVKRVESSLKAGMKSIDVKDPVPWSQKLWKEEE